MALPRYVLRMCVRKRCVPEFTNRPECQTTESVLACLHCAFFGCGHDCNNHFDRHCHLFPTHAIWHAPLSLSLHSGGLFSLYLHFSVEVNERTVYCALCESSLQLTDHTSNRNVQDLMLLLQDLNDEQTLPPLHLDAGAIVESRPPTPQIKSPSDHFDATAALIGASSSMGRKRRQSSIFGRSAADFERRDQLVTLLRRWQLLPLANAFHTYVSLSFCLLLL